MASARGAHSQTPPKPHSSTLLHHSEDSRRCGGRGTTFRATPISHPAIPRAASMCIRRLRLRLPRLHPAPCGWPSRPEALGWQLSAAQRDDHPHAAPPIGRTRREKWQRKRKRQRPALACCRCAAAVCCALQDEPYAAADLGPSPRVLCLPLVPLSLPSVFPSVFSRVLFAS